MAEKQEGMLFPNGKEFECGVLGTILLYPDLLQIAINHGLKAKYFYNNANRKIYKSILQLFEKNHAYDLISIVNYWREAGELESIGGAYYLTELTEMVSFPAALKSYIEKLYDIHRRIGLLKICNYVIEDIKSPFFDYEDLRSKLDKYLISSNTHETDILNSKEIAHEFVKIMDSTDEYYANDIPTGYKELDEIIGGLRGAYLIIIAGRPSMGKTALALNFILSALKIKKPVLLFSLEMSPREIYGRLVTMHGRINNEILMKKQFDDNDISQLQYYASEIADMPLFIVNKSVIDIYDIDNISTEQKEKNNIGMVVVDHLQEMRIDLVKGDMMPRIIGSVANRHKEIAKKLNIPVVLLSQLHRTGKTNRPVLDDLKYSGDIENAADIVLLIHREKYFNNEADDIADIIIAKNRNMKRGIVKLVFVDKYASFEQPALKEEENNPY